MMSMLSEGTVDGKIDDSGGSAPVDEASDDSDTVFCLVPNLQNGDHPDSKFDSPVPRRLVHGEVERERKLPLLVRDTIRLLLSGDSSRVFVAVNDFSTKSLFVSAALDFSIMHCVVLNWEFPKIKSLCRFAGLDFYVSKLHPLITQN